MLQIPSLHRLGNQSQRRKLDWKKVKDFPTAFALVVATVGGAGLAPLAPGTMGTLVAMPFAYLIHQTWRLDARVLFWVGMTALGTWAAKKVDQVMQTEDNQNIVIDEFVGLGLTTWSAGPHWETWAAGFVLFRLFDTLKPPPVRQVDGWSKNHPSANLRAFAVIADDLVAGVQSLLIILFLQWLHILP